MFISTLFTDVSYSNIVTDGQYVFFLNAIIYFIYIKIDCFLKKFSMKLIYAYVVQNYRYLYLLEFILDEFKLVYDYTDLLLR